jgi:hypothetical protein
MKGGYVCLGFQLISVIMDDLNQFNKFLMSYHIWTKKQCKTTQHFQSDKLSFGVPKPYLKIK